MGGFEVPLNGGAVCSVGAEAATVGPAMVTGVARNVPGARRPFDARLELGGLAEGAHLDWQDPRDLSVGDEILLRIVLTVQRGLGVIESRFAAERRCSADLSG